MSDCINHPGTPAAATCARCKQPNCENCLVEFLGARYCGPCRNLSLTEAQGLQPTLQPPLFDGTGTVDLGRWLSAGWQSVTTHLATWMTATLLFLLLSICTFGIGLAPAACGLSLIAFRILAGRPVAAMDVTLGFRRFLHAFATLLLLLVPWALFTTVQQVTWFGVGFVAESSGGHAGSQSLAMVLSLGLTLVEYLVDFAIGAVSFFSLTHVAARNVNPINAIRDSWLVVRQNFWMFLVTAVLFQVIALAGFLVLCVGILVTTPLVVAATTQAYVDHFGLPESAL